MLHVVALGFLLAAGLPFDDQKKGAVPVERLSSAVASLVGICPDGLEFDQLEECKKNLKAGAKGFVGKKVYVNLGAGHENFLRLESKSDERARIVWAPLIDLGNGLALTVGRPQKLSAAGNVVVAQRPFDGSSDPEVLDTDLKRAISIGAVGIEVVGTFGKAWELSQGGKTVRGVSFEPTAIRFFHARTGKMLVEVTDLKG